MNKAVLFSILFFFSIVLKGQYADSTLSDIQNSAQKLMMQNSRLTIGGYGEVHYNQRISQGQKHNGILDVHRIVMLVGYKFNERTQFITELEFEHIKEVYVEQAFLQYKINNYVNFRGGLLLIPMGIINEYHEPTTFNGVERPFVDKYIAPTTWREIGFGLTGNIFPVTVRYQVYLVNGFNGYDGQANLNGANGLRKGRQKGAESFISSPNISGKVEFYGARGLNIGFSGYFGNTQSTMYDGLGKNDDIVISKADSSVVGVSMFGIDARYSIKGFQFRGQYYNTTISNTRQYNYYTSIDGIPNDLGSSMTGYYLEAAYNVFRSIDKFKTRLIPFVRYENYDTHNSVEEGIMKNEAFNNTIITTGLTWNPAKGAVLKMDIQFVKSAADSKFSNIFNAGFGVMF